MHRFRTLISPFAGGHGCDFAVVSGAGMSRGRIAAAATSFPPFHSIRRTLILQSDPEQVKLHKLFGSDYGIVEMKLDRAESRNAIGREMLRGLQSAIESIKHDPSVNVVLLSSSVQRVFCAGADLKERKLMSSSDTQQFVNSLRSTFSSLEVLSVPSIAIIEGAAMGGGLEMALACDLRICGEDASFGMPETGLAIIPGAGGTQRLPRIVGRSMAKSLIFTGSMINGKEAFSMGLVNCCVPAGEAHLKGLQVARDINQKGPLAIRMAKQAINCGMEVELSSGLVVEQECYARLLETEDRLEGLAAFDEKRKPTYAGK